MRAVENLIPAAIAAITSSGMSDNGAVNKAYKGYISSLGASIIQSGLLPTLAMYKGTEGSDNKKAETSCLLNAIFSVVKSKYNPKPTDDNLFDYALRIMQKPEMRQMVINEIMNASIAVKLAIRTFKLIEP
jgi:CRISPR-associated protein Cmr5